MGPPWLGAAAPVSSPSDTVRIGSCIYQGGSTQVDGGLNCRHVGVVTIVSTKCMSLWTNVVSLISNFGYSFQFSIFEFSSEADYE